MIIRGTRGGGRNVVGVTDEWFFSPEGTRRQSITFRVRRPAAELQTKPSASRKYVTRHMHDDSSLVTDEGQ